MKFFSEIEKTIYDFGGQIVLYDTIDLQLARKNHNILLLE